MRKIIISMALLVGLLCINHQAFAWWHHGGHHWGGGVIIVPQPVYPYPVYPAYPTYPVYPSNPYYPPPPPPPYPPYATTYPPSWGWQNRVCATYASGQVVCHYW